MSDFFIDNRIYYHDTDTGGVVYYATYLEHMEEARTEYLRGIGVDVAEYTRKGMLFPVVHIEVDYKSPARYGDTIRISAKLAHLGNASMEFEQKISRSDTLILSSKVVLACVDANMKPRRIPEEIRTKYSASQKDAQ